MSKAAVRLPFAFAFPVALSSEEKRHKELQDKYKEMSLAERKAALDKNEKNKAGKRTVEEAEEATSELIKKVQEGKITVKKSDDKHFFKRSRLASTAEGGGRLTRSLSEDGEIEDPHEGGMGSPNYWNPSTNWSQQSSWQTNSAWSQPKPDHNTQKTIYVKGFELQREVLRETFEKYGNIRRINMGDKNRHAFVEFTHHAEAEMAIQEVRKQIKENNTIQMDGNMIAGTTIHVSFARRKEQTFDRSDSYNPSAATPRADIYNPAATPRIDSYNPGPLSSAFEDLGPSDIA